MKLTFYFKSGANVTIDSVTTWGVKHNNNGELIEVTIGQIKEGVLKANNRLVVKSLDMKSIDCIIESE